MRLVAEVEQKKYATDRIGVQLLQFDQSPLLDEILFGIGPLALDRPTGKQLQDAFASFLSI